MRNLWLAAFLLLGCSNSAKGVQPDLAPSVDLWPEPAQSDLTRWHLGAGTSATAFQGGIDPTVTYMGGQAVYLKSLVSPEPTFGSFQTSDDASSLAGRRVRLTAFLKTDSVDAWAGLWLRSDIPTDGGVRFGDSFDNMQNRSLAGTTDWGQYSDVIDVPADAAVISYGVLVNTVGEIRASDVTVQVVDSSVPLTGT
jgi:hypothetical protein